MREATTDCAVEESVGPMVDFNPGHTVTEFEVPLAVGYGSKVVEVNCPVCNAHVVTWLEGRMGLCAWLSVLLLLFLGFFFVVPWCLLPLPFCCRAAKDLRHRCPNCQNIIGKHRRCFP